MTRLNLYCLIRERAHTAAAGLRGRRIAPLAKLVGVLLLAVLIGACGDERKGAEPSTDAADTAAAPPEPTVLAEAVGEERTLALQVLSLERESAATLALTMALANTSTEPGAIDLSQRFASAPPDRGTLADVYLAESGTNQGRKLFVLRDADDRPDTSRGLTALAAGERVVVHARFPAPPDGVREVDLHVPLVPVMRVPIS